MADPEPPVILLAFAREDIARHEELPRLPDEQKQLRGLLDPAIRAGRCELVERPAVTLDEILAVFQDNRYRNRIAVFHFAGHADGYSLLVEDSRGKPLPLGAAGLAQFLAAQAGLKLVFLNGCSTLEQAEGLHAVGVPAVVATHEDVDDDLALRFAVHFYRGLAGEGSIGEAFGEAQGALQAEVYAEQAELEPGLWVLSADEEAKRWKLPARRVRPAGTVPLQKPLRSQHFTGREQELAKLLEDLQPGKVVTLCGPGGMGKSALAAEAVWTLAPGDDPPERFPDGIVFHTFYDQPQAGLALEAIARAYGVDPRPSPRDAARRALAGRQALLLLDETEVADDLDAVLAVAANCGVLITTGRHEDAPDEYLDIDPLPRAESLALLRAWAGHYAADEAAANEIVRLLGGLPFALVLAGRYLAQRKQQASEYAAWLSAEGLDALHFGERWSKSVPLLLERDLAQVSPRARAALGVTGILAFAPFERASIAAALEVTPEAAGHALGELVDYCLLLRPDDRYRVTHALAHLYARAQAAPGADVVERLANYYAGLAETESAKGPAGFAALDRHRTHIVAVQAAALKAGQWRVVRQITWALQTYLDRRGYWIDRIAVLQAGLDAARAEGARYDAGMFLNSLGMAYADVGDTRRALELLEQARRDARQDGDPHVEAGALGTLGTVYARMGNPRRAITLYKQQLAIARRLQNATGTCAALGNLGGAYKDLGQTPQAVKFFRKALDLTRELGDRPWEGATLDNLGNAYAALGESRRAIELYEQALVIVRETGDRRGEGVNLGSQANAYYSLGDIRRAVELYEQALVIMREIGDRHGTGVALNNLGNACSAVGDSGRAIEAFTEALAIEREIGDRRGEGYALGRLGLAKAEAGAASEAVTLCGQYLALMREIGHRRYEGEALSFLGRAYRAAGDSDRALDCCRQAVAILEETEALEGLSGALVTLAEVQLGRRDFDDADRSAQRAAEISVQQGYRRRLADALWVQARARDGVDKQGEALGLAQQALAVYDTLDHPKAAEVRSRLDEWLGGQAG